MIKIRYQKGRYAPLIICDSCGKQIENAKRGVAVSSEGTTDGEFLDVLHGHKGDCHKAIEARLNARGWDELEHHLLYLNENTDFGPAGMAELRGMLDEIGGTL